MSKHICPKCKFFSFNSATSLSLHINKCSILQKRIYRPNIFQNSSILAGDNIPANKKRLYSNQPDTNQSEEKIKSLTLTCNLLPCGLGSDSYLASSCKRPLRWRQIRFFNIRILLPAVTSDHRTRCNRCGISQLIIDQIVVADVQIIGKKSQSAFSSLTPASTLSIFKNSKRIVYISIDYVNNSNDYVKNSNISVKFSY